MDHLSSVAWYEGIWRVIASIAAAAILIVCCATGVASALMIAAHVALFFSILMIRNAGQLVKLTARKTGLPAPASWTQSPPATLTLQFAKLGAGLSAGLSGAALIM